jgi:hypothetical protein
MRIEKKHKYLAHALLVSGMVYWFSQRDLDQTNLYLILLILLTTTLGSFAVQYPNVSLKNLFINNLLPLHLVAGALLTLIYFPNLGLPVQIVFIAALGIGVYIVSLVTNVFLVVEERDEVIPLYRVAITWVQIIVVVVAIPYFAGIYKIPYNAFVQNVITGISSGLFAYYITYMLKFDEEARKVRGVDAVLLSLLVGFIVAVAGFSVSFMPTEAFLRALFVSSVLMFGLNYIYAYLKNNITKRLISENLLITFIFFILLVVFVR